MLKSVSTICIIILLIADLSNNTLGFCAEKNVALVFENGDSYEGEIQDEKPEGKGVITLKNGSVYSGNFKLGKFDGYGVLTDKSGMKYDGEWENGLKSGTGIALYVTNGSSYRGEWKRTNETEAGHMYVHPDHIPEPGLMIDCLDMVAKFRKMEIKGIVDIFRMMCTTVSA